MTQSHVISHLFLPNCIAVFSVIKISLQLSSLTQWLELWPKSCRFNSQSRELTQVQPHWGHAWEATNWCASFISLFLSLHFPPSLSLSLKSMENYPPVKSYQKIKQNFITMDNTFSLNIELPEFYILSPIFNRLCLEI